MAEPRTFRMGRLDHVHIHVPDRAEAAAWYAQHLGFEPVEAFDFWAAGVDGGPLQISADGGATMLALFEAGDGHPMIAQQTGVAFSVDADGFIAFARSLPGEIMTPSGQPLLPNDIIDFDLCWAFDLADPWGNRYELNCYDYALVRSALVEADELSPVRYWPRARFDDRPGRRPVRDLAELTEAAFRLVAAGDHDALHGLMSPDTAAALTADVIAETWSSARAAIGELETFRETVVELPDGTVLDPGDPVPGIAVGATELVCADGASVGRVAFDEQARIIGLLIVPTDHGELAF